ncbi:hypothetical protein [Piscinibacter koreensis]|uniref:Uncharacterized protein n=1 Tax=Piscinibacter koreensis TaxID=2742824 RepID=A0A7Y6NS63_9BURK|nr:hypothetical protein [Schlegelella koreensis]NUZ08354.1 hypothetical protein [Schlegelella koreensis]
MSRYDWPADGRAGARKDDDSSGRRRFMARRRQDFDPDGAIGAARGERSAGGPASRAPASSRTHLWIPLGPQVVLQSSAGSPRISGRINALAVHPQGERLYAASANGGVWYSGDGGAHWRSLAGLAATATAGIVRPAHRNSCHAIAVQFGVTELSDEVWVGTGEVSTPLDGQPGSSLGGVGILHALHPAVPDEPDPWKIEATNLAGSGVYRIALEPGGSRVLAATRIGLFQRPAGGGLNAPWELVQAAPFDAYRGACSDVLWTPAVPGGAPARVWVWMMSGSGAGLYCRDMTSPPAAAFARVAFAAGSPAGTAYQALRGALAASTPPSQVWAVSDAGSNVPPALFRVSNTAAAPAAAPIVVTQDILGRQGDYDIAIDVDPADPNRVVLGGSFFDFTTAENVNVTNVAAAILVGHVAASGGALRFGQPNPASTLGLGTHPDVHGVYFSNAGARLWAATDGGVSRSDRHQDGAGGAAPTVAAFYPRNEGLQVVESNYVAHNPVAEGCVAAGLQDNGSVLRLSSSVWKPVPRMSGDGGGLLPRPINPEHWICQYTNGNWSTSDNVLSDGDMLRRGAVSSSNELNGSAFYSTAAGIATTRPSAAATHQVGQVIFGTTRVWYTEETRALAGAPAPTALGAAWFTLPTGTDPLPGDANAGLRAKQDDFGQQITVCRWQDRDVAWVLGEGKLMRYARVPGSDDGGPPGTWSRETIIVKDSASSRRREDPLRASAVWTDVAVNLDPPAAPGQPPRAHGSKGAVYLGNIGKPGDANVDTLWWYDGSGKWFKTGLRTDSAGVPAPVTAIVCDPAFPDEVYVGTTVGVWRGLRTQIDNADPAWTWSQRVNGLPEAAVEDLAIFNDGQVRLLRAAIAARGVWELRLDQPDVVDLTYLRCHQDDLRHRPTAVALQNDGRTARSWHGSPDVRPRAVATAIARPANLPWGRQASAAPVINAFQRQPLARFQAALRSARNDPRVVPNGRWDSYFSEVLRDLGAPVVVIPAAGATPQRAVPTIDNALWDATMVAPHATRNPWGDGAPSEADLIDFHGEVPEGQVGAASMTFARSRAIVDVVVHHRGLLERPGADVRVVLLRWSGPAAAVAGNPATWTLGDAAGNVPWTLAVNQVLNSDAGTTAIAFGGGWSFVRTAGQTRLWKTPGTQTLDALNSATVPFEVDLVTGVPAGRVVVLVAVLRAGVGASADVALPAAITLPQLALTSPNVAVRSLHLTP